MKLSIIIPVYNVEKWLERCVNSVEHQDLPLSDYEVILVNDGSKDKSGQIAMDLSKEYDNIIVVNKNNGGMSSARNAGMAIARGDYYMFVDSDDYIYPNVIGSLISVSIENKLDVCHFSFNVENIDGKTSLSKSPFPYEVVLSGKDVYGYNVIGSVWANLISASLIKCHNLSFFEGIIHEDVEFNTRLFCYANRIMFVDKCVYHYCFNPQSSWRSKLPGNQEKDMRDALIVSSLQLEFAKNNENAPWFKERILNMVNTDIVCGIFPFFRLNGPNYSMFRKYIGWAQSCGVYPIHVAHLRFKFMIIGALFNSKCLLSLAIRLLDRFK